MSFNTQSARFSIRPEARSWRWEVFDEEGQLRRAGLAPSRSAAAALVILARCQGSSTRRAA